MNQRVKKSARARSRAHHLDTFPAPNGLDVSNQNPDSNLCAQSIIQSAENSSRQETAAELLRDFAEWLAFQDECRRRIRG